MSYVNRFFVRLVLAGALLALQGEHNTAAGQEIFRDPQFEVQVTRNIVYGTGTVSNFGSVVELDLELDLYEPTGPDVPDSMPGILLMHGGGFLGSSRTDSTAGQMAPLMAERGYVAVSIDYRLHDRIFPGFRKPVVSDEFQEVLDDLLGFCCPGGVCACGPFLDAPGLNTFVAATEDAGTAHSWLIVNAETLRLDPSRIALGGSSAGGTITRWRTYHLDEYGIENLPAIAAGVVRTGAGGGVFLEDIEAGEPPLFINHNEDDPSHPFANTAPFVSRLESERIPLEFHHSPGDNERARFFGDELEPGVTAFDLAVEFLYFHLFVSPDTDIKPWHDTNSIDPFSHGLTPVAILGSDSFDVTEVDVTTLAFGPGGAPPAFDLTNPLVYWLNHWDVNHDGEKDLLSYYRIPETGIALGDTEACLAGETQAGRSFQDCDAVRTVDGCGHGHELAFLVPPLVWMRQRRRAPQCIAVRAHPGAA